MAKGYILEIEGKTHIKHPSASDVETELSLMRLRGPSFFILSAPDGSYVQAAGARLRLIVEHRRMSADGFRHYVLGRAGHKPRAAVQDENAGQLITSINHSGGAVTLQQNQVFTLRDASEIFIDFLTTGEVSERFEWHDVTERFSS